MSDLVLDYLKKHGVPVTRENYVTLDTLGDEDGKQQLDGELEAEVPEQLQIKKGEQ